MLPDDGKRKKAVVQQSFPLRLIHYGGSRGGVRMEKTIIIRITNPTKAQDALLQRLVRAFRAEHIEIQENTDFTLLSGSLQIDPQRRLVWQSGQTVELTPMEFDILLLLARRPGQVFTARQIYEAVATDSFDASWTGISSMVYKLRRKLGADIIETVRGHGYKFVAPGTSLK